MDLFKKFEQSKHRITTLIACTMLIVITNIKAQETQKTIAATATGISNDRIVHPDTWERLNVDNINPITSPFGDEYDVNSGMLSFKNVDVSIPGNFNIPMAVHRSKTLHALSHNVTGEFGNWSLDLPRIERNLTSHFHD